MLSSTNKEEVYARFLDASSQPVKGRVRRGWLLPFAKYKGCVFVVVGKLRPFIRLLDEFLIFRNFSGGRWQVRDMLISHGIMAGRLSSVCVAEPTVTDQEVALPDQKERGRE